MSLSFSIKDGCLIFSGVLNERVPIEFFRSCLEELGKEVSEIGLDFSDVSSGNSMGLRTLHDFLSELDQPVVYKNVPYWLVEQFNLIRGFVKKSWKVESLILPFYHPDSEEEISLLCEVGKDIPKLDSYEDFEYGEKLVNGQKYLPDFDPSCDLVFLDGLFAGES